MRLWDWMKRKIWREPTKEEIEKLLNERLSLDSPGFRRDMAYVLGALRARDEFEEIIVPGQPPAPPLSRARDFDEAYKEIFGRTMEEDLAIQEALGLYEDLDEGSPDLRVV